MTDRTPEQTDAMIDRTLEISAENTRNISQLGENIAEMRKAVTDVAATVTELASYARNRTHQHDLELDDHDVRIEVQERLQSSQGVRMDKIDALLAAMDEDRKTTQQILQIMMARFAGEPPQV